MNTVEAIATNRFLSWVLGLSRPGVGVPTDTDARQAAQFLADKARAAYRPPAGLTGADVVAAWPWHRVIEPPEPIGAYPLSPYGAHGNRVWLVPVALGGPLGLPAYEVYLDAATGDVSISPLGQPWKSLILPAAAARRVFIAGIAATQQPKPQADGES